MSSNLGKDEVIEKEEYPGLLSIVNLSVEEREVLLDFLDKEYPSLNASFIFTLLSDETFLRFFDVLAGETIKVPTRARMMSRIEQVKIFVYVSGRGYTTDAYERASKIYGRRVKQIVGIVERVKQILEESKSGE